MSAEAGPRATVERDATGVLVIRTKCGECQVGITLPCRDEETGAEIEPGRTALLFADLLICEQCASERDAARERGEQQRLAVDGSAPPRGVADPDGDPGWPF